MTRRTRIRLDTARGGRRGTLAVRGSLLGIVCVGILAGEVLGQGEGCEFLPPSGTLRQTTSFGITVINVSNPNLGCRDGSRVVADSVRYHSAQDQYEFFGNVRFEDPTRVLEADFALYVRPRATLDARGNAHLTRLSDGMELEGDRLYYAQAMTGRPLDEVTVTGGRPRALLFVTPDTVAAREAAEQEAAAAAAAATAAVDTLGVPPVGAPPREPASISSDPVPYEVIADRIEIFGEDDFRPQGRVEITRQGLFAFAENKASFDRAQGLLLLIQNARVEDEAFDLDGDSIEIFLPGEVIQRVTSKGRAVLTGDDLDVRAPEIRIFMVDDAPERLVAVGLTDQEEPPEDELSGAELPTMDALGLDPFVMEHPSRAVAKVPEFAMVGDSLDMRIPEGVLQRVFAVGDARGESLARDTLPDLPELLRRDWMDGQSIEAVFVESAPTDQNVGEADRAPYRLERLIARGRARTFYGMRARQTESSSEVDTSVEAEAVASDTTAVTDTSTVRVPPPDSVSLAQAAMGADSLGSDPPGEALAGAQAVAALKLAYHLVEGDTITLVLNQEGVERMDVVGQVRGVHWEPRGGSATGRARPANRDEPLRESWAPYGDPPRSGGGR